jgi:hypothetical protein
MRRYSRWEVAVFASAVLALVAQCAHSVGVLR